MRLTSGAICLSLALGIIGSSTTKPPTNHKAIPISAPLAPQAETISVQVTGEVKAPGTFTIPAGSTLTDAIKRAGGLTIYAVGPIEVRSKTGAAGAYESRFFTKNRRGDRNSPTQWTENGKRTAAVILHDGDQVRVPHESY